MQKDGMNDAVGTNWVDEIKTYAERDIDDKFRIPGKDETPKSS